MARQSECEHDIGIYRIVGGSGLDVIEKCSECGTLVVNESPKTKFLREAKKARKKTQKKSEDKEDESEVKEFFYDVKDKAEEAVDDVKDYIFGEDDDKPKRKYTKKSRR
jgi:hypothetical protein